jgi:hypothetical protein
MALQWTDEISEGYEIAARRFYCDEHGQKQIDRLTKRGVAVQITRFTQQEPAA